MLECYKEYSPEKFDTVIKEQFLRDLPSHVSETVAKRISKDKWNKAKRMYEERWSIGNNFMEDLFESIDF